MANKYLSDAFATPKTNRDCTSVRVFMEKASEGTGYKTYKEWEDDTSKCTLIPNIENVSSKSNWDTEEHDYFNQSGKSTMKKSQAPSIEIQFIYSDSAVHEYLSYAGNSAGDAGMTIVEIDSYDGNTYSFVAIVNLDNFAADGAPSDGAKVSVTFTYAGGNIIKTKTAAA